MASTSEQDSGVSFYRALRASAGAVMALGDAVADLTEDARGGIGNLVDRGVALDRRLEEVAGGVSELRRKLGRAVEISTLAETTRRLAEATDNLSLKLDEEPWKRVIICYAHDDPSCWLEGLQDQLKPLMRADRFEVWTDRKIEAGAAWRRRIRKALAAANVAVLLVSPKLLASDFIMREELPVIVAAADEGRLHLVWLLCRACHYKETELARFQAAHPTSRPLDTLPKPKRAQAMVEISRQIRRLAVAGAPGIH